MGLPLRQFPWNLIWLKKVQLSARWQELSKEVVAKALFLLLFLVLAFCKIRIVVIYRVKKLTVYRTRKWPRGELQEGSSQLILPLFPPIFDSSLLFYTLQDTKQPLKRFTPNFYLDIFLQNIIFLHFLAPLSGTPSKTYSSQPQVQ